MDPGDSYFVHYLVNLASQMPELLACVIGVFLGVIWWWRNRRASLLLLTALQAWAVELYLGKTVGLRPIDYEEYRWTYTMISFIKSLITAGTLGLLIYAVYSGRTEPDPKAPPV